MPNYLSLTCAHCQNSFSRTSGEHSKALRKGKTKHYCSRRCADTARATGNTMINLICDACGVAFSRAAADHNRNIANGLRQAFCSAECSAKGRTVEQGSTVNAAAFTIERRNFESGSTLAERIAYYSVPKSSGCIEWSGTTSSHGRPTLVVGNKKQLVSRLVWTQKHGEVPEGRLVRHLVCRNPMCINIDHLAVGTSKDNADDRERDGTTVRGSDHPRAKLTEKQILAIHSSNNTYRQLADQYGVSKSQIARIKTGESWKQVSKTPEDP